MKKRKNAAGCVSVVLLAGLMIGCGDSGKAISPSTENVPVSEEKLDQALNSMEDENGNDNLEMNSEEGEENSQTDDVKKEEATLIGSVKSIGKNSLVIRQAFEEDKNVLVEPGEGSSDEVLISVNVSESTQYEVKTVKNSGINGDADVERREGSFSDLKEAVSVDISGYYEGETFWAEKISIMVFV